MLLEGFWGSRQQELARREEHAGVDQAWGGVPLYTSSCTPSPPRNCASVSYQEHPFFTLHKTKKTDIAAFVKEILGEDS